MEKESKNCTELDIYIVFYGIVLELLLIVIYGISYQPSHPLKYYYGLFLSVNFTIIIAYIIYSLLQAKKYLVSTILTGTTIILIIIVKLLAY